jgi:hypothetical protein
MWKEFPGKTASSPADLAMINAGYGDAFKHPTMVYKKVRIAREVKADHTNSRTIQDYEWQKRTEETSSQYESYSYTLDDYANKLLIDSFHYVINLPEFLIKDPLGNDFHGVNQNWFLPDPRWYPPFFDKKGEYIARTNASGGCGIAAATDTMLYISQSYGNNSLFPTTAGNPTFYECLTVMWDMSTYVTPLRLPPIALPFSDDYYYYDPPIKFGDSEFRGALGVWPQSTYTNGVQEYANSKGVDLIAHGITADDETRFNKETVESEIIEALENGSPVSLHLGVTASINMTDEDGKIDSTSRHWISVVGIDKNYATNETRLKVVSWGKYYYINLDDFIDSAKFSMVEGFFMGGLGPEWTRLEKQSTGIVWFEVEK